MEVFFYHSKILFKTDVDAKGDFSCLFVTKIFFVWPRRPSGKVANVLECDIIVSDFEIQSRYYVHFWNNTLGKV